MNRLRLIVLLMLALNGSPLQAQVVDLGVSPGSGVFVLTNSVDSWAPLIQGHELVFVRISVLTDPGSLIDSYQATIDARLGTTESIVLGRSLQDELQRMGLERVAIDAMGLDTTQQDHVSAACSVNAGEIPGAEGLVAAILVRVSYWSAETLSQDLYVAMTKGYQGPGAYSTGPYVRICADLIGGVLVRLGFRP